jgi:integration host factor subunit beta
MIKSQLVDRVAQKSAHLNKYDAEKIVNAIFDCLVSGLARRDRVELRGFGSFTITVREARPGRNPKTGAAVNLSERILPRFKASKGNAPKAQRHSYRMNANSCGRGCCRSTTDRTVTYTFGALSIGVQRTAPKTASIETTA